MLFNDFHNKVSNLYTDYRKKIHPLIILIQNESGEFPTQILNEIRSFDFHIACCYFYIDDDTLVNEHIDKATEHIDRMLLDCYKIVVNIIHLDKIKKFEKYTEKYNHRIEKIIDNGSFLSKYRKLKNEIKEKTNTAQISEMESKNKKDIIKLFEDASVLCWQLEELIDANQSAINELIDSLKRKITIEKVIKILGWIVAVIGVLFPDFFVFIREKIDNFISFITK